MSKGAGKITHALKTRRKALLSGYDDEDLHRFRVNIRRARALLKQYPGDQSRNVRKEWRSLAEKTNAARDWDTLAIYVDSTLAPEQRRVILPRMQHYREIARDEVIEALRSDDWDTPWRHWLEWAEHGEKGETVRAPTLDSSDMLQAARNAAQNALSLQDERSWHKFRIAIKNLRYSLDSHFAKSSWKKKERKALKRLCKQLQEQLGHWHDTVVHARLLESMFDDLPVEDPGKERNALRALLTGIESRRARCLDASLDLIEREGHILGLRHKK